MHPIQSQEGLVKAVPAKIMVHFCGLNSYTQAKISFHLKSICLTKKRCWKNGNIEDDAEGVKSTETHNQGRKEELKPQICFVKYVQRDQVSWNRCFKMVVLLFQII